MRIVLLSIKRAQRAFFKAWLFFLLIFSFYQSAYSQSDKDVLSWFDFNYAYLSSPKWTIGGDGGTRGILTSNEFTKVYLRPSASFKVNKDLNLYATVAGFQTFRSSSFNLFELRLAQQVQATWPRLDRIYFTHRLRNEERFYFENQVEEAPENDSNFENRLRYRLGAETNYFNLSSKIGNVKLLGGIEYFQTFQSRTDSRRFNDSRISAGFGQLLTKGWSYSLLFIWQRSRDISGGELATDQYVVRLRVYLKQAQN